MNWGKEWFEFFPNAPVTVMNYAASLLQISDNQLLEHFVSIGLSPEIYVWSLFKSVFTEVFSTDMWLKAFDHIFSMPPSFLFYFICAYLSYFRKTFFQLKTLQDLEDFFHTIHACDLDKILHSAYDMHNSTIQSSIQRAITSSYGVFTPLQKGQYVLGLRFPKHSVDFQMKQREKIARSEEEIDIARTNYESLKKHNTEFEIEHRNWLIRQRAILEASRDRQQLADQIERELLEEKERIRQLELQERLKNIEFLQERRKMLGEIQEAEANLLSQTDQRLSSVRNDIYSDIKHMTTNMHLNQVEKMEESKRMDYQMFVERCPPAHYTPQPTAAGIGEMIHPRPSITSSEWYQTTTTVPPPPPQTMLNSPPNLLSDATTTEPVVVPNASSASNENASTLPHSNLIPSSSSPSQQPQQRSPQASATLSHENQTNHSVNRVEANLSVSQPPQQPSQRLESSQKVEDSQLSFAEGLNVHMLGKEISNLQKELDSLHKVVEETHSKEPQKKECKEKNEHLKKKKPKKEKKDKSSSSKETTNDPSTEQKQRISESVPLSKSTSKHATDSSSKKKTKKKDIVRSEKNSAATLTPTSTCEMSVQTDTTNTINKKKKNSSSSTTSVTMRKDKSKPLNDLSELNISSSSSSSGGGGDSSKTHSSHHEEEDDSKISELRKSLSQQKAHLEKSEGALQHIENLASYISQQTSAAKNSDSNISRSVSSISTLDTSRTSQVYSRFDYLEKVDHRVNDLIQKKFKEFMSKRGQEEKKVTPGSSPSSIMSSSGGIGKQHSPQNTSSIPSNASKNSFESMNDKSLSGHHMTANNNLYEVEERNLSYPTTTNTTATTATTMNTTAMDHSSFQRNDSGVKGALEESSTNRSSFLLNETTEKVYSSDTSLSVLSNKRVSGGVRNRGSISSTFNPKFESKYLNSPESQKSDNDTSSDVNSLLRHSSDFETIGSNRVNVSSQPSSESSNSLNDSSINHTLKPANMHGYSSAVLLLNDSRQSEEKPKTSSSVLTTITSYPSLSSSVESIQLKPQDYSSLDLSFFSTTSSNDEENVTISTSCLISDE